MTSTSASSERGLTTAPTIIVDRVSRTYTVKASGLGVKKHTSVALDDVSLTISAGTRFGIVGESGSGKTTLLRLIAGLDQPTSGGITFVTPPARTPSTVAQLRSQLGIQMVFQDPASSLNPRMRIADVIAEPLIVRKAANRAGRVREALESVGLDADAGGKYPHQFSGGQRQRISLARALVGRPPVLLADEPVSALDVSTRVQVLQLLAGLTAQWQPTIVIVSHDLSVIGQWCDSMAVLHDGTVVECGSTVDVFDHPQHSYTRSLMAAVPSIETGIAQAQTRARQRQSSP